MTGAPRKTVLLLLERAPLVLFALILLAFGAASPKFLHPNNLLNILIQASSAAILASGMTFVLLTAGIDLSVGAIMFVTAAILGTLVLDGWPLVVVLPLVLLGGVIYGAVNAFFIARLRMIPFIVTLATVYVGRGLGLWITETRAMNLPESVLAIGSHRVAGILPVPVLVAASVIAVAHLLLRHTGLGRQIYAVGQSKEAAVKAGIRESRVITFVYLVSGACATIGGVVSLAQLGAVSPTFGTGREFAAVAAAVLGGTSLFGGRGGVFPGTVLGALLIQMIENGLVILNADPYVYPLITAGIIFTAVLLDSIRFGQLQRLRRRRIRPA